MLQRAASNAYSWWWASHIRTKQSKWLEQCLQDMDEIVQSMLKLIEEDGDSFAKRAEMYYKRRPELIGSVEEVYKQFRALADRYDLLSKELQNANHTIATVFPEQVQFAMSEDEDGPIPKFPPSPHFPNDAKVPQVPKAPIKELKNIISKASKQYREKKSSKAQYPKEKSGLTKEEALEEISKLQKEILALQTVKEFVKSSYESGIAKYWGIENQIMEMQQKVSRLQDEFDMESVIEDGEARTLMAEAALKSCQEMLALLEEKQEKSMREAKEEYKRIEAACEKLQALKVKYLKEVSGDESLKQGDGGRKYSSKDVDELIKETKEFEPEKNEESLDLSSVPCLTVSQLAEKIDLLVNKVINLETAVSSQTVLVNTLRSETDDLNSQIQNLEDENVVLTDDNKNLSSRVMEMEEKLNKVQDLNKSVESQSSNLQTSFSRARTNLGQLSEKLSSVKVDEEEEGRMSLDHLSEILSSSEKVKEEILSEKLSIESANKEILSEKLSSSERANKEILSEKLSSSERANKEIISEKLSSSERANKEILSENLSSSERANKEILSEKLSSSERANKEILSEKLSSSERANETLGERKNEEILSEKLSSSERAIEILGGRKNEEILSEKLSSSERAIETLGGRKNEEILSEKPSSSERANEVILSEKPSSSERANEVILSEKPSSSERANEEIKVRAILDHHPEQLSNEKANDESEARTKLDHLEGVQDRAGLDRTLEKTNDGKAADEKVEKSDSRKDIKENKEDVKEVDIDTQGEVKKVIRKTGTFLERKMNEHVSEDRPNNSGEAAERNEELNWQQMLLNGMEDGEKILLKEYTTILRNYKDVKRKLNEAEKREREAQFDITLQLRELRKAIQKRDDEITALRQRLNSNKGDITQLSSLLQQDDLVLDVNGDLNNTNEETESKPIFIERTPSISPVEEKLRTEIDAILDENLDFWFRFSTAFHQVQKFKNEVKDLQEEITKIKEKKKPETQTKSEILPIYKHLREIQRELAVWLEKIMPLKDELKNRFASLCNIQEDITKALKEGVEEDEIKFSSHQAAKLQGEILNMKQENNKVSEELQAGLDHVSMIQLQIQKTLRMLDEEFGISSDQTENSSRHRVPLRSFIFGTKQKKQKSSIFSCMHPNRRYQILRAGVRLSSHGSSS